MADCQYEDWNDWIGQRVCAKETMFGTLRYFGKTSFSNGVWCGIELDDALGKNDGTVFGIKYFTCKPNYGIFVPISKVTKSNENSNKGKENVLCESNTNKTFEIPESCVDVNSVEVNNLDKEPFASSNLANEIVKKTKNNLARLRMDSEESLGILCSDEFDKSCDFLSPDYSLSNKSLTSHQFDINCAQDFVFTQPYVPAGKENMLDTISYPRYASTPRQVIRNKFVGLANDLEANLSLDMDVQTDRVFSDTSVQNNSNVFFDFDKFKYNPNLSSTSKTCLNFDSPIQENKENVSAFENKNSVLNQQNNLNITQTFSDKNFNVVCKNDVLNATFPLVEFASCTTGVNETKESYNTEIIQMEKTENDEILNCTFKKENLNLINEFNLNATYELKLSDPGCQNFPVKKIVLTNHLSKNINICDESDYKNIDQKSDHTDITLDNVFLAENKLISVSSSVKNKLSNSFDINSSSLEFNADKIIAPEDVCDVSLSERKFATDSKLLKEKLNDPIKQNVSTSDKAMKRNNFEKESFSYKNKFLKELDKIQSSGSDKKNIPLPSKNVRRSLNMPRNCDKKLNLNSTFCVKRETLNAGKHSNIKNLLEPSTNKINIQEKGNNEFKKPFMPHTFVRNSKLALKPQSSINTKTRGNKLPKSCFNENLNPSKSSFNTSNEIKVSSFVEPNITAFKSGNRNLPNTKSKLPLNSRHSLKLSTKASDFPSNNLSSTVPVRSHLLNPSTIFPFKQENNVGNKQCSDLQSFCDSKNITANIGGTCLKTSGNYSNRTNLSTDRNIIRVKRENVNNNEPKQLKVQTDVQNSNKSKLPKTFRTLNTSTHEKPISVRNSLSSYSVEKLPIGIVKPRSSLSQPIKFVSSRKLELQNKRIPSLSHSTEKAESKAKGQFASGAIQSLRYVKVDTSKSNRK